MERERADSGASGCAAALIAGAVSFVVSVAVSLSAWALIAASEIDGDGDPWPDGVEDVDTGDDADLAATEQPLGETLDLTIDADDDTQSFSFDVAADAVAVRVRAEAQVAADIDLFAAFGTSDAYGEDWWEESVEDGGREEVLLQRHDAEGFAEEPLIVQVVYYGDAATVPYTLRVDVVRFRADGPHDPGADMRGTLEAENGFRMTFEVRVPAGAEALRLDVVDVDQDVDLYVDTAADTYDTSVSDFSAETEIARESIVLDGDSDPPLAPGRSVFVTVCDRYPLPEPTSFRLVATASADAPSSIGAPPTWPALPTRRERALAATVEVLAGDGGGSGTIVRADGLVLTAHHVVDGVKGEAPIVIAVTLDVTRPARDAFRARVLHVLEEEDLALLEIVSDLYGRPLPEGYRLPTCPVAWDETPRPGDVLHTLGYPSIGGWTGRGAITFSTGVMAGHGVTDSGPKLKTDAVISSGSSGGAAIDAGYRLVGVPTQTRWQTEEGSETLGYASPVSRLPAEWRRLIEAPVK